MRAKINTPDWEDDLDGCQPKKRRRYLSQEAIAAACADWEEDPLKAIAFYERSAKHFSRVQQLQENVQLALAKKRAVKARLEKAKADFDEFLRQTGFQIETYADDIALIDKNIATASRKLAVVHEQEEPLKQLERSVEAGYQPTHSRQSNR